MPDLAERSLSCREVQILVLIGAGKTTKEIAALLTISASTVSVHRKHLCKKLGAHSAVELASYGANYPH